MRIIPTRLLSWVKRIWPRLEVARSDTVAETGWELLPFSFRVDWFQRCDASHAPGRYATRSTAQTRVSIEAMSRLNALWEAQNWSTGGELHLSPDEVRNGLRSFREASNEAPYGENGEDVRNDVQDFYVRKPTRERGIAPWAEDRRDGDKP